MVDGKNNDRNPSHHSPCRIYACQSRSTKEKSELLSRLFLHNIRSCSIMAEQHLESRENERKSLLHSEVEHYGLSTNDTKQKKNRVRLATSMSLGSFKVLPSSKIVGLHKKSYSVDALKPSYLTPIEMGRQELYTQVPFTAVFGLQKKEKDVSYAFAHYTAELNVESHPEWSARHKRKMSDKTEELILDELQFDTHVVTTPLVFAVVVATASQFLVGYNTGVMNAPEKVVFPDHTTALWSLAVAAFAVGGPFGAIVGGKLADSRGRRGALLVDTWTFLIGGLLQTLAPDMYTIIASRFIIGLASGFSSVLVPIYLGEIAPPTLRGLLGTLTQFALVIGILIANLLAFPFATEHDWRALFAATPIVAIIQLLCSPFLLETPRWLLNRDPKSSRARYIIKQLRGMRYDHEVEHELSNYIIGEAAQHQDEEKSQLAIISEMVSQRGIRMLLVSSLFLQMANQLSGINAIFYYSTLFFEGVIDNPLIGTTIVGAINVVATYVALLLMDSNGRKTLILWSSGGMFLSCIAIILSLLGYFSNILALVAVNLFVFFYEIGLGPIPWLIVAEMFEGKYVATAMSLCCQLNWACNFVIGFVFPSMNSYLGPYSFGPFAAILATVFLYALLFLQETQGTKPEDLIVVEMESRKSHVVYDANKVQRPPSLDVQWRKIMDHLAQEEMEKMDDGIEAIDGNIIHLLTASNLSAFPLTFFFSDYGFASLEPEIAVTVQKQSENERLGIAVVVRAGRLYINEISQKGLCANTPLEVNDMVVAINGVSFKDSPNAREALAVVQNAKSNVTFIVQKVGIPLEI